jgi:uncharacterized membrane protein YdfJ with MMPL/SSD domain
MAAIIPAMIQSMRDQKQMMLNQYQSQKTQQDQTMASQGDSTAMGDAFDAAKNDDSFYLPPEAFDNADFKRGIKLFLSPDGHAVRFTIIHQGDPLTQEGTSRTARLKTAAEDAIKGTPLEGSSIYLGGSAAVVGHRPLGGRRRLQPPTRLPNEGGDPRRTTHGNDPRHGRHRLRGDLRGIGVRLHHGVPWR